MLPKRQQTEWRPVAPSYVRALIHFTPGNYSTILQLRSARRSRGPLADHHRMLIEPGLRFDEDEIVRTPLFSPRLAGIYILDDEGNTNCRRELESSTMALASASSTNRSRAKGLIILRPANGNRRTPMATPPRRQCPCPTNFFRAIRTNTLCIRVFSTGASGSGKETAGYAIFLKLEFLKGAALMVSLYNTLNGAVSGHYLLGNLRADHYDAISGKSACAINLSSALHDLRRLH